LTHVPDLAPVLAEFARVLRPGGHVVLCDLHPEQVALGAVPSVRRADGTPGRVTSYVHRTGDYLRAALAAGLRVPRVSGARHPLGRAHDAGCAARDRPGAVGRVAVVAFRCRAGEAARAAFAGVPVMILWHLQRSST
jgi:SAM-dependent methyltransferase